MTKTRRIPSAINFRFFVLYFRKLIEIDAGRLDIYSARFIYFNVSEVKSFFLFLFLFLNSRNCKNYLFKTYTHPLSDLLRSILHSPFPGIVQDMGLEIEKFFF